MTQDLIFRQLDSIMYFVKDLNEGIAFFAKFGMTPQTIKDGWCNLHMQGDGLCIDLTETIDSSLHGDPYYVVENVWKFYAACLEAEVEVIDGPFEVMCGDGLLIEGPSGIRIYVLDRTKQGE